RISLQDSGMCLRGLRERPVCDLVAVGKAAALEQPRLRQAIDELGEEARLPDAGGPVERDELRRSLALDTPGDRSQDRQLLATADERRAQARDAHAGLLHCSERNPGCEWLALTLFFFQAEDGIRDRTARR